MRRRLRLSADNSSGAGAVSVEQGWLVRTEAMKTRVVVQQESRGKWGFSKMVLEGRGWDRTGVGEEGDIKVEQGPRPNHFTRDGQRL